jgi:hypothetical protein
VKGYRNLGIFEVPIELGAFDPRARRDARPECRGRVNVDA